MKWTKIDANDDRTLPPESDGSEEGYARYLWFDVGMWMEMSPNLGPKWIKACGWTHWTLPLPPAAEPTPDLAGENAKLRELLEDALGALHLNPDVCQDEIDVVQDKIRAALSATAQDQHGP